MKKIDKDFDFLDAFVNGYFKFMDKQLRFVGKLNIPIWLRIALTPIILGYFVLISAPFLPIYVICGIIQISLDITNYRD